jgi:hypothetical protein
MSPTASRATVAGAVSFGVIALVGAAWPHPASSEKVTFHVRPAHNTISARHQVKPVFHGEPVTIYRGSKVVATGRLDANATTTFNLAPARYLFCVRQPAGITVPGASERDGFACEPAQTGHGLSVVTFEYHQEVRS